MKKTGVKNDPEKFIYIKLVTPGYTQETKSTKRHALDDEQEAMIYKIYEQFKNAVFDVVFLRKRKEEGGG